MMRTGYMVRREGGGAATQDCLGHRKELEFCSVLSRGVTFSKSVSHRLPDCSVESGLRLKEQRGDRVTIRRLPGVWVTEAAAPLGAEAVALGEVGRFQERLGGDWPC